MKLIEKVVSSFPSIGYRDDDIIRDMCPLEMGIFDIICKNEEHDEGYHGCEECWNQEYCG